MNETAKKMGRIIDTKAFRDDLNGVSSAIAQCFRNYISTEDCIRLDDFRMTMTGFSFVFSCRDHVHGVFVWTTEADDQGQGSVFADVNIVREANTVCLSPEQAHQLGDSLSRAARLMHYLRSTVRSLSERPMGERADLAQRACISWRAIEASLGSTS